MRGVKPVQLRQGPDGSYTPQNLTEHNHARYDIDYSAPCLFLREQPMKITGSASCTITRITTVGELVLTEAADPLSIGVNEFAINYTTGIVFLNDSSVTALSPVSSEIYKAEYSGLGTLVSSRDILGKTYTPMVSISDASPITRFALEQEFTVKRAHIPTAALPIPADSFIASTTLAGMLIVLYKEGTDIKYTSVELSQGVSEATSSWSMGRYAGTTSLPSTLIPLVNYTFTPVSINSAVFIASNIVYRVTIEGDVAEDTELINLNSSGLVGIPSVTPVGDGSFILSYLQALLGESTPNYITALFYSTHNTEPYEQVVLASSTTFPGGNVAAVVPSEHGITILTPYISGDDLVIGSYKVESYLMPVTPSYSTTFSGSTTPYLDVSYHGVGPAGEMMLSSAHGTTATDSVSVINVSDSGVANEVVLPIDDTKLEQIISVERFQSHYLIHTLNDDVVLTSHLVNAINFGVTTSQTKIDMSTDTTITTPSELSYGILSSGGWYAMVFFDNTVLNSPVHSVWYAKFNLDNFIEWNGIVDADVPYIDDTTDGIILDLSTSSSDMLTVNEGDTSVVQATVSAVSLAGEKAAYNLTATFYNDSGTLEIVPTSSVEVISATAAAVSGGWMAKLTLDSGFISIEVFGNGATSEISFEATGKLYR